MSGFDSIRFFLIIRKFLNELEDYGDVCRFLLARKTRGVGEEIGLRGQRDEL